MFIIAGLGNPTLQYEGTRHNVGFDVIDMLADRYNISVDGRKGRALIGKGMIGGQKVLLVKPQTYMNLSGESLRELVNYYKIDEEHELLVIYDDISLDVGQLRIRKKGSAGGHNGIKSIIANLGTDVFPRVKIGVGAPKGNLVSHVLGKFSDDEVEILRETIKASSDAVSIMISKDTKEAMNKLKNSRVAVFGVGGVGGYVCEALARSGVGTFDLIDDDKVCLTNLNRQIIATRKTVGKYKVEVMKERILDINPDAQVNIHQCFFLPENADEFSFDAYDYVVDAVDTVTAKIEIIMQAKKKEIPVISSMGAGNKLDPTAFRVADIYKTKVCPLAKVMRRELKKRGVKKLKVVYSEEQPIQPIEDMSISCRANCICPPGAKHKCTERRAIPGSVAFVPSVVGLIIAGEVVKDIAGK